MLNNYINNKYLANNKIEEMRENYINAKPFPHIELSNFFLIDHVREILNNFPDLQKINTYERKNKNEKKFGLENQEKMPKNISDFILFLNSQVFLKFLQKITGIYETLLPDPYLIGGGLHETKKDGFLKIHSDFYLHQYLKIDRRLNLLLYLNDDWKDEYGGHLELWDKTMTRCDKKIEFKFNHLCIFSTDNSSFHGYPEPIKCPNEKSRKSIALYYYSNGRPKKELMGSMPNTTNWKSRSGKNEVDNKYTIKDFLRKVKILRSINNIFKKK